MHWTNPIFQRGLLNMALLRTISAFAAFCVTFATVHPTKEEIFEQFSHPNMVFHYASGLVGSLDTDGSKELSPSELQQFFFSLNAAVSADTAKPLFDHMDSDQNGELSVDEVYNALVAFPWGVSERVAGYLIAGSDPEQPVLRPWPILSVPLTREILDEIFPDTPEDNAATHVLLALFDRNFDGTITKYGIKHWHCACV